MIEFVPIGNTVIVEMDPEVEKLRNGIILPGQKIEQPVTGKVVAIGPGRMLTNGNMFATTVKAGDRVLFGKFAGTELEMDDKKYYSMSEDDIMAVIKSEAMDKFMEGK